jgi:hypothetical protein
MASPIHSYLFSPPASPPTLPHDHVLRSPALNSIRSLIPTDYAPRSSQDGPAKRSPFTTQTCRFTTDVTYPFDSRLHEVYRKSGNEVFTLTVEDASLSTPRPSPKICLEVVSGQADERSQPINTPTVPSPIRRRIRIPGFGLGLPRPVIRLIFLGTVLLATLWLLSHVPRP